MSERYEYVPLTEAEVDEMTGLAPIKAAAANGDKVAALLLERIAQAEEAMRPTIEALREEWVRDVFEHGTSAGGLSLLVEGGE